MFVPEQCEKFEANKTKTWIGDECPDEWFSEKRVQCDRWVFDKSERTIVNDVCPQLISFLMQIIVMINYFQWAIMCPENQWKLALIGTLHFAGIVVGSGVFGVLADRYVHCISHLFALSLGDALCFHVFRIGRKKVFLFCILFMSLTGIGQALSNSYVMFSVFAFLNAFGTSGVFPLAFIIGKFSGNIIDICVYLGFLVYSQISIV